MSKSEEKAWVVLEVRKVEHYITAFRGRADRSALEAWARGELGTSVLKLEDVYWNNEEPDADTPVTVVGEIGTREWQNCTGELWVRADTIIAVYFLRDGRERRLSDAPKGRVLHLPTSTSDRDSDPEPN